MVSSAIPAGCQDFDLAAGKLALCPRAGRCVVSGQVAAGLLTEKRMGKPVSSRPSATAVEIQGSALMNARVRSTE